ncbi:unnamed protein product, partial [Gongylonema pulchrum]|uniref:Dishevelled domain-containing protein n=1 Tax=Gongylonema pulchrum TaxID=637853 RepID=A0A183F1G0_9BILA
MGSGGSGGIGNYGGMSGYGDRGTADRGYGGATGGYGGMNGDRGGYFGGYRSVRRNSVTSTDRRLRNGVRNGGKRISPVVLSGTMEQMSDTFPSGVAIGVDGLPD